MEDERIFCTLIFLAEEPIEWSSAATTNYFIDIERGRRGENLKDNANSDPLREPTC